MISIVVAFYNAEKYLEELLISIQQQLYQDFELILVDDGSTDHSLQIIETFLSNCKLPAQIIRQANAGACVARNKGRVLASGEYIVFVDADDVLSPYYLQQMLDDFENNDVDMVICGFQDFTDSKTIQDSPYHKEAYIVYSSNELLHRYLYTQTRATSWSVMARKELIEQHNIVFAEGFRYNFGTHYIWRLLAHARNILVDPTILYYYRVHPEAAMSKVDESRLMGQTLMQNLLPYFQEHRADFAEIYAKYGEARWVWGTLWQVACAMPYKGFRDICFKMNTDKMMKRLHDFPSFKVRNAAKLYSLSPWLYYIVARRVANLKGVNRTNR